jgi:ArsR family transcriptional regulator
MVTRLLDVIADCPPFRAPDLDEEQTLVAASVFAALGHPARVRLVMLLASSAAPVCLCHLVGPLGLCQSTVSQHLARLTGAGLTIREERGKWSYFSLNREAVASLPRLLALAEAAAPTQREPHAVLSSGVPCCA